LQSISKALSRNYILDNVIVVDNKSNDGSAEGISTKKYNLNFIYNNKNYGFAKACNIGSKNINSSYILFLNPDTQLLCNSISAPLMFMEKSKNKNIAVCGINLINEHGRNCPIGAKFPSLSGLITKIFNLHFISKNYFPKWRLYADDLAEEGGFIDEVTGAFFLIRKNIFTKLNGFDQRFFVYFDEVDLSYRVSNAGYKSYLMKDVSAIHYGAQSTKHVRIKALFYSLRSRILYTQKHFKFFEHTIIIILSIIEIIPRSLRELFHLNILGLFRLFCSYTLFLNFLLNPFCKHEEE
jgi:GT2 family glycosyltransferase